MRFRPLFLLAVALGCGLLASIGVSQVMQGGDAEQLRTEPILVATTDIDYGDELTEDNTRLEDWPSGKIPPGSLRSLAEAADPAACRLVAGVPVTAAMLRPDDSPARTIPRGYRVVTARVTLDAAAGNLLKPGDRVDLIAFFRKSQEISRTVTRKILRNVRVFAVNAATERIEGGEAVVKTVGFLVKEEQVERTMLAIRLGEMSVALRRPDETDSDSNSLDNPSMATVASLLNAAPGLADEQEPAQVRQTAPSVPTASVPSDGRRQVAIITTSGEMVVFDPREDSPGELPPGIRSAQESLSSIRPGSAVLPAGVSVKSGTPEPAADLGQTPITPEMLRRLLGGGAAAP